MHRKLRGDVIGDLSFIMKLLVDAHCFDLQTTEGVNTYIKGLYGELIKEAGDIDFYFAAQNTDKLKQLFGERRNVHYIALASKNKVYRLLFEFPAIVKANRIDAVHYQYTSSPIKNCKNIITLHDILFKDYPKMFPLSYRIVKGFLFRISAMRADLLLTVSDYSRRQIAQHYHIPIDDIFVTPNAVSDDFANIDKAEAISFVKTRGIEKYLLYVSRIEPRKNHIALLRAYNELALWEKGYHLVIIGRRTLATPNFDAYYEHMDTNAKQYVHVMNQVSYSELKYWYKAASLFVYPALAEGFGIPPIEAAAAGIPCVCSNRTAMSDFTFLGNHLIDPQDDKLLKGEILQCLSQIDNSEIKSIQHQIYHRYNWNVIAKALYQELKCRFKDCGCW